MFFILSKTVALLLLPSNFLLLLALVGLVLTATRFRRTGWRLTVASLLLLVIAGVSPLGALLLHQLETRFPPWDASRGPPDGIIVLGGVIDKRLSVDYGEPSIGSDANRLTALAKLARDYPNARIVYSGGDASLTGVRRAETEFLAPLLDAFGVPRERVLLEARSRNTAENAAFSKALVMPKPGERWLLVTSAWHMPRAIGCFRQAGFDVEAYPVGWRTRRQLRFTPIAQVSGGLALVDLAVHEWAGLVSYRLSGRIPQLLPGPAAR